jgi:hypothetical protein
MTDFAEKCRQEGVALPIDMAVSVRSARCARLRWSVRVRCACNARAWLYGAGCRPCVSWRTRRACCTPMPLDDTRAAHTLRRLQVLTTGAWPSAGVSHCILPAEMQQASAAFEEYYTATHKCAHGVPCRGLRDVGWEGTRQTSPVRARLTARPDTECVCVRVASLCSADTQNTHLHMHLAAAAS